MYCSKCGSILGADVAFCTSCGTPVVRGAFAGTGGVPVPPNVGVAGFSTTRSVIYAGFWLRFVAYLIDGLILGAGVIALVIPLIFLTGLVATMESLAHRADGQLSPGEIAGIVSTVLMIAAVALVVKWLYFAYFESGEKQATWGKQALGLYVTDGEVNRITFGRASGRFFAKIITGLIPFGIGYIMAGFTEKKQALHDMIAGCLVLRR